MADPANSPNAASDTPAEASDALTSSSPDQHAGTQAPADTHGDNQASSPDAPVDDRAALLAVVQSVVETAPKTPPQGEGDAAAPELAGPKTGQDPDPNKPDPLEADPTEEELAQAHPRSKARIERLLQQRNSYRTDAENLKPDAEKWAQMHGYLVKNDLAAEDVNLLLGIGAALRRGDFKSFRDGVMPYIQLADQALGLSLPADLQSRVENGEMSAEAAAELSTARFQNGRAQQQVAANEQARQAQAQQAEEQRIVQAVQQSVVDWERSVQARDPDYARKAPLVVRFSQALIAEHGRPRTPEAALELARRAYEEATQTVVGFRPAPVATRPQPSGARAVNGVARAEPRTLMEAALMGLERGRA